ncbi:MAG: hypothetical protein ACE5QV_04820 [Fidelibacterota bacterium]
MYKLAVSMAVILLSSSIALNQDYNQYTAAIHLDSKVGGGDYSLAEMGEVSFKEGVDIAIVTDHDNALVEIGIYPFQKILKKSISRPSIKEFGAVNYYRTIEAVNRKYKDLLFLAGSEASAFYYWEGSPFKAALNYLRRGSVGDLSLVNIHKHMLVIGLRNPEDVENLPSLARGFEKDFSISSKFLINVSPSFLLILGLLLLTGKRKKYVKFRGQRIMVKSTSHKFSGILLLLSGGFLMVLNFPYFPQQYNQYKGDPGIGPYQEVIDYVNERGGMTFWAHPESNFMATIEGIKVETPPYPEALLEAQNYTGFAIFWEGMKYIGPPGGIWDRVLNEYCEGIRDRPVWAISELDFEKTGESSNLRDILTVLLMKKKSANAVYDAMAKGRMYAARNFFADKLRIEDFFLTDNLKRAVVGEILTTNRKYYLLIRLKSIDGVSRNMSLQVIKNGKVTHIYPFRRDFEIFLEHRPPEKERKDYFRLMIMENRWPVFATNPIFVQGG